MDDLAGPILLASLAWLAFWAAVAWFAWKARRIVEGKEK